MNTHNAKLFWGSVSLSVLFLCVGLLVYFLIPASEDADVMPVSAFNSNTSLFNYDFSDEALAASGIKNDLIDEFASKDDRGLSLYRQPKTRAAVEWFYTHVTSSREVALAILENADKNDIPLSLAFSLAFVESSYNPYAVNKNSNHTIDRGLFQLNSASFPKLTETDFFDPKTSAKYGMMHLRFCIDVAGNEITALAMYNAGTSRVKNNKTPQHTLNYVGKIERYRSRLDGMFSTEVLAFYDSGRSSELAMVNSKK